MFFKLKKGVDCKKSCKMMNSVLIKAAVRFGIIFKEKCR